MSDCREILFKEKSCSNMPFYLNGIPMYKVSPDGTVIFSYFESTNEGIAEYVENGEINTATLEDYKLINTPVKFNIYKRYCMARNRLSTEFVI